MLQELNFLVFPDHLCTLNRILVIVEVTAPTHIVSEHNEIEDN